MHPISSEACSEQISLTLMTTWIDDWNPGLAESNQSFLFRMTIGQHFTQLKWFLSCREKLMHERKQTGCGAKLLCGGMRPGGPQSGGPSVTWGQSRAEPS